MKEVRFIISTMPLRLAIRLTIVSAGGFSFATHSQLSMAQSAHINVVHQFNIPAQPLGQAIATFMQQSGLQITFDNSQLSGMKSQRLQGNYTHRDGLQQLLKGSPIAFHFTSDKNVQLRLANRQISHNKDHKDTQLDVIELDTLNVQASQSNDDWVYETPHSVAVISREQINRKPPRHAADMLEETAGVYTAVSQQDPALSVNIRGIQDFGRVNTSIDGMRQNFQQSGHGQRNGQMYIDPSMLSGITIDKGASSGMGGAGVIGGIANFRTIDANDLIKPGKEIGGKIRYETGIGARGNGTNFIGSAAIAFGNDIGDVVAATSERRLGDYKPGRHGKIGELRTGTWLWPENSDRIKTATVDYSGYVMRSQLFKLGLNLPQEQRVQLSYLRTQVSSDDAAMMNVEQDLLWKKTGSSHVETQNMALDYRYDPDNEWIDFKSKLYYVDTKNKENNLPTGKSVRQKGYTVTYQTKTYGAQAENTSTFHLGDVSTLKANYGLEFFYDKTSPDSNQAILKGQAMNVPASASVTPKGERGMGSLFTKLDYNYNDWFNASAGLRYDRYRLKGKTAMSIAWPNAVGSPIGTHNIIRKYNVDTEEGHFSPTFGIAINPGVDWLQLFANYGKGWRPPAITESLVTGRPHAGGTEMMYPNPFLKPETSRNWEVGFNILKQGLITQNDRLGIKVAYFDTKVDDFMFMGLNMNKPGHSFPTTGSSAYVNNLATTRFRGVEYQINYDMGYLYSDLTYTHMIGNNDFCHNPAWLGGVVGYRRTPGRHGTITEIYPVNTSKFRQCKVIMGTAEHMPMDRGSLTLGTRLFDQKVDMGVRARYSQGYSLKGGNDNTVSNTGVYPADWKRYVVYDFYSSYKATDDLTLRLSVENFTDHAYMVPLGDVLAFTLGRGRTVQAGFEYHF